MSLASILSVFTLLPLLAFVASSHSSASANVAEKRDPTSSGPSDLSLINLNELTPYYLRLYDSDAMGFNPTWSELFSRNEKRKRGADSGSADQTHTEVGKRLFVARIGKRGRMMPIYRARVG